MPLRVPCTPCRASGSPKRPPRCACALRLHLEVRSSEGPEIFKGVTCNAAENALYAMPRIRLPKKATKVRLCTEILDIDVSSEQTLNSMEGVTCNAAKDALYAMPRIRLPEKATEVCLCTETDLRPGQVKGP